MRPAAAARTGLALTLTLVLAGCGRAPELAADRAGTLQGEVLTVTSSAAAGDWDAADAGIAALHAQLDAALDAGDVSTARYHQIDQALERVTSEVSTQRVAAAAQLAAAQAAAQQSAADQTAAAAEVAAPDQPTATPASGSTTEHPAPGPKKAHKPKKGP